MVNGLLLADVHRPAVARAVHLHRAPRRVATSGFTQVIDVVLHTSAQLVEKSRHLGALVVIDNEQRVHFHGTDTGRREVVVHNGLGAIDVLDLVNSSRIKRQQAELFAQLADGCYRSAAHHKSCRNFAVRDGFHDVVRVLEVRLDVHAQTGELVDGLGCIDRSTLRCHGLTTQRGDIVQYSLGATKAHETTFLEHLVLDHDVDLLLVHGKERLDAGEILVLRTHPQHIELHEAAGSLVVDDAGNGSGGATGLDAVDHRAVLAAHADHFIDQGVVGAALDTRVEDRLLGVGGKAHQR